MATDRHAEALPMLEAGLASWLAAMDQESFYVPEVRLDLAMALAATGRYAAADSLVELVLHGHRREPPRPGAVGSALLTRAQIDAARGQMDAAVAGAEAALASLDEDGVAPRALARARAELALGEFRTTLGSLADAESPLLSSYRTFGTLRGPSGRETSAVLRQLVRLYEAWERPAEAERFAALLQSATAGLASAESRPSAVH
jgi:tetratricopeptide (TPR) repeat protein